MGLLGGNKDKEAEAAAKVEETKTETKVEEKAPEIKTVEKNAGAPATMDAKAIIKKAAEEKRVIRRSSRMDLIVIKKTKHYKVGVRIEPAEIYGEDLVKRGIAKEFEEGDEKKYVSADKD